MNGAGDAFHPPHHPPQPARHAAASRPDSDVSIGLLDDADPAWD